MQHLDEGTIHAWLDGALDPDESARVEAHVAECPQCAAAVAEARGFIAASSRILTALDHVPRGVVPVARPARWSNPAMWRAAAAVLVVAAGSLVVVRNTGRDSKAGYTSIETPDTASVIPFAPPITILAKPSQGAARSAVQQNVSPAQKSVEKRVATGAVAATEQKLTAVVPAPRVADLAQARAPSANPNIMASDKSVAAAPTAPPVSDSAEKVSPASGYASVQPTASRLLLRGNMSALSARDSVGALEPLKVVGRPRQIGAKITLYEVTPTDTVTLTEFMNVQLESVVLAGRLEGQAAGKAAAAPSPRADAAVAGRQDAQREAGGVAAAEQARARSVPAPVTAVGTANGVTTVTWTDAGSGNVLKLSGRLPLAQLQQIKIRIERERTAAAAAAKKNP
jgi:anti-sigma factor RsiW